MIKKLPKYKVPNIKNHGKSRSQKIKIKTILIALVILSVVGFGAYIGQSTISSLVAQNNIISNQANSTAVGEAIAISATEMSGEVLGTADNQAWVRLFDILKKLIAALTAWMKKHPELKILNSAKHLAHDAKNVGATRQDATWKCSKLENWDGSSPSTCDTNTVGGGIGNPSNGYQEAGIKLWKDGPEGDMSYSTSPRWSDCACFVGTLMVYSGVDTGFPVCGLTNQVAHMDKNTSRYAKYRYLTGNSTTLGEGEIEIEKDDIKAGDILVIVGEHTAIIKTNGGLSNYTASAGTQVPNSRGDIDYTTDVYPNAKKYIYRVKG